MASGIDSTTSAALLSALLPNVTTGTSTFTITAPLKCLFLSGVRSTDTGSDTEWTTSGGYTAGTGFSGLTFAAASSGAPSTSVSNVAATITNAPAQTWAGCKIVTSDGTAKTLFWATLSANKTVNAGDTVTVPSGSFTATLG